MKNINDIIHGVVRIEIMSVIVDQFEKSDYKFFRMFSLDNRIGEFLWNIRQDLYNETCVQRYKGGMA